MSGAQSVTYPDWPPSLIEEGARLLREESQTCGVRRADYRKIAGDLLSVAHARDQLSVLDRYAGRWLRKGGRFLDIGAGWGALLCVAHRERGLDVFGVEPSPASLALGRKSLAIYGLGPSRLVLGEGEAVPFASSTFDVVYSSNVLEHVRDPERVLKEGIRVLRPGGVLQFVVPSYHSFWEGHYGVFWLPGLDRLSARRYLRILGKDPRYMESLQLLTPACMRSMVARIPGVEVLGWGEDLFEERLSSAEDISWGLLDRVMPFVRWMRRTGLASIACRLSRWFDWFNPIVLTLKKY